MTSTTRSVLFLVPLLLSFAGVEYSWAEVTSAPAVKLAVFDVDATPPLGSEMAYDPVKRFDELTLRCRGVVLLGAEKPIVLCAVDWIGIANEGHDAFRDALAAAAGTTRDHVAVHTLHQHDAPGCDFSAERILRELNATKLGRFESSFHREVIQRAANAIRSILPSAQPVTHYGWGVAEVREVASNRRIPGPDGRIRATRYTATKDPALRAEPEGLIDPQVTLLSFWNDERPLAVLSYYACHPQSYYRTGVPSSDFPGIARFIRGQAVPDALHVHFNGAGGNIGAGKYNDGSKENRMVLALRLAEGMQEAWTATQKYPVTVTDIQWRSVPVSLPVAPHLNETELTESLKAASARGTVGRADQLAWLKRCEAGNQIDIACLQVGRARVLHLPGELFVEYQLAAKRMRPDLFVSLAAYGDYGPGYIGTAAAYPEGGYETSPGASSVSPRAEQVLSEAMQQLLEPASHRQPLVFVSSFAAGDKGAIQALQLDPQSGSLKLLHRTGGVEHPFFLAVSPEKRFLYSIHARQFGGTDDEFVTAYEILGHTGELKLLNRQSARGTAACYLHIDATGKTVLVANYTTGSVAALPIQPDGSLGEAGSFIQHSGSSINPSRQKEPHAHSIVASPDNRFVFAADLGTDQILSYRLDPALSRLTPNDPPYAKSPPGAGPRHLTFHPNGRFMYVINELSNTISVFDYDAQAGSLSEKQTISTLPPDFTGTSHCADVKITPNGRFLYGTNRGHDSIAAYRIDSDGRLALIGISPSGGKGPQNLAITPDGDLLLCANLPGNNLSVFQIDPETGNLTVASPPIPMPSPSCIMILR